MAKLAIVLFALIGMTGCAGMQQQDQTAALNAQMAGDMEFCRQQWETAELAPIHSRWSHRADQITPLMFGHEQIPTPQEAELLKRYLPGRAQCVGRVRATMATYYPMGLAQLDTVKFRTDIVLAELVNRRITWGNGARLAYQAYLEAANQFTEDARRDMERREALAVEQAKANAQLVGGLANAAATRQRSRQAAPASMGITNCRWFGNGLNCRTF